MQILEVLRVFYAILEVFILNSPGDISCIIVINFLPRVETEAYFSTVLIKLHHSLVDGVSLDVVL